MVKTLELRNKHLTFITCSFVKSFQWKESIHHQIRYTKWIGCVKASGRIRLRGENDEIRVY